MMLKLSYCENWKWNMCSIYLHFYLYIFFSLLWFRFFLTLFLRVKIFFFCIKKESVSVGCLRKFQLLFFILFFSSLLSFYFVIIYFVVKKKKNFTHCWLFDIKTWNKSSKFHKISLHNVSLTSRTWHSSSISIKMQGFFFFIEKIHINMKKISSYLGLRVRIYVMMTMLF